MGRENGTGSFTFVDLFAGVGGFHHAMQELGGECVFASEIDEDCQRVYKANFDTPIVGDIEPFTENEEALGRVPPHDVLCAGFPCQPFSKSGFQRGIAETRGTLFFDILKILEFRRPRFAVLENVRNLAGPRQRSTWETIIRNLRRLGYRVASEPAVFSPHLLPPSLGGRPQVRDRVFILCEYVGEEASPSLLESEVLVERRVTPGWDPNDWRIEEWLQPESELPSYGPHLLRNDEQRWLNAWNDFIKSIPTDTLPGFPIWVDAFTTIPEIPQGTPDWKAGFLQKNSAFYRSHRTVIDRWIRRHDVEAFPASRRKFEWQARRWQPRREDRDIEQLVLHMRPSGIRVKPPTYLPALVAITQTSIIGRQRRRITPREAARLQGFPDSFELDEDDARAFRQLGNAVNVGAVQHVARILFESSATGWPGGGQEKRRSRNGALPPRQLALRSDYGALHADVDAC